MPGMTFTEAVHPAEAFAPRRGGYAALPKTVTLILYLFITVSFSKYDFCGTLLFACLPYVSAAACGAPVLRLLRRTLSAMPFVLCAGAANCFLDRSVIEIYGVPAVYGGALSLFVLVLKTAGTVGAVLLFSRSTPAEEAAGALGRLGMPQMLVLQMRLLFRYAGLVSEEAAKIKTAYFMRNPGRRTMSVRDWGAAAGRLFLRCLTRGEGIYAAMQCRLFRAEGSFGEVQRGSAVEWSACIAASLLMLSARCVL